MGRLLLLRHGQSTWNAEGRWQGWVDTPLSDEGRAQSRALAAQLAATGALFAGVVSSDLERARETAGIVAGALGLGEVVVEPGLRERDVGDWSGRTTEEIELIWPGVLAAWRSGRIDATPGGEHEPAFVARVTSAVERRVRAPGGPWLGITHGGVIRSLVRSLGGTPQPTNNLAGWWLDEDDRGVLRLGEGVALTGVGEEPVTSAL